MSQSVIYCCVTKCPITKVIKPSLPIMSHRFMCQEFGQGLAGWFFHNVREGDSVVLSGGQAGLESPGELHSQGGHVAMTTPGTVHLATPAWWPDCAHGSSGTQRGSCKRPPGGASCDLVSEDPNSVLSHLANRVMKASVHSGEGSEPHLSVGRAAKNLLPFFCDPRPSCGFVHKSGFFLSE